MVHARSERVAFRAFFAVYAAGLITWLVLGLLPVRMSGPGMAAAMADTTTPLQTVVQYAFSALNVALGLLLVARRPDDRVPRLLGLALLGTAATFNLPSHRVFHLLGSPWPVAAAHFTFHVVSGVAYVWAVVLFPDGTLPARLRLGRGLLRAVVALTTAVVALVCWRGSFLAHPQFFVVFFGVAVPVLGVGVQLVRIADPGTEARERATARLLCAALLPALATSLVWSSARVVDLAAGPGGGRAALEEAVQSLFPAVFAVVPVVLCAGVARYRLWDVDRLLTRVLAYGLVVLTFGAAYVVAVVAGGWLAGAGGLWVTAAVLTAVAVAVEPVRALGRRWANRVVFGQVLSPTEAMGSLADSLEHLTPRAELQHVVDVLVAATRAEAAHLWLLDGDRLVRAASSPGDGHGPVTLALEGTDRSLSALTERTAERHGWPITHQGEVLGVLTAAFAPGVAPATVDVEVATGIAEHAGVLVHNAQLAVTLARQVADLAVRAEELSASRRGIVAAQDAERRRIERDLHDGAQQALVATIISARACLTRPPVTRAEIEELGEILDIAQESIEDLCGDGRPEVLSALGLRGALDRSAQLVRRAGVVVDLDVRLGPGPVLRPELETAVYFCCVECLQNVTKYAGATRAAVVVEQVGAEVTFAVVDDGAGFDPTDARRAGGLAQLSERLVVLGGTLTVGTGPSGGVVVRGRVPIGRDALVTT